MHENFDQSAWLDVKRSASVALHEECPGVLSANFANSISHSVLAFEIDEFLLQGSVFDKTVHKLEAFG
jgi:hypothetical protein